MDDFAVDLDKVLDDFEQSEDTDGPPPHNVIPVESIRFPDHLQEYGSFPSAPLATCPSPIKPSAPCFPEPNNQHPYLSAKYPPPQYGNPYQPPEALDLSEANFAPIPLNTHIPRKEEDADKGSVFAQPAVHLNGLSSRDSMSVSSNSSNMSSPAHQPVAASTMSSGGSSDQIVPHTVAPTRDDFGEVVSHLPSDNVSGVGIDGSVEDGHVETQDLLPAVTSDTPVPELNKEPPMNPMYDYVLSSESLTVDTTVEQGCDSDANVDDTTVQAESAASEGPVEVPRIRKQSADSASEELMPYPTATVLDHGTGLSLAAELSAASALQADEGFDDLDSGCNPSEHDPCSGGYSPPVASHQGSDTGAQNQADISIQLVGDGEDELKVEICTKESSEDKVLPKEVEVVGFGDVEDDDVDVGDMDAYLRDVQDGDVHGILNATEVLDVVTHQGDDHHVYSVANSALSGERKPGFRDSGIADDHLMDSKRPASSGDGADMSCDKASMLQVKEDPQVASQVLSDVSEGAAEQKISSPQPSGTPTSPENTARRGSFDSVEKFLVPNLSSPNIATPMDDAGFSKVPGFATSSNMPSLIEEVEKTLPPPAPETPPLVTMPLSATLAEQIDVGDLDLEVHPQGVSSNRSDNTLEASTNEISAVSGAPQTQVRQNSSSSPSRQTIGIGARPKDLSQVKKVRPNSLLGLSTPDLAPLPTKPPQSMSLDTGLNLCVGSESGATPVMQGLSLGMQPEEDGTMKDFPSCVPTVPLEEGDTLSRFSGPPLESCMQGTKPKSRAGLTLALSPQGSGFISPGEGLQQRQPSLSDVPPAPAPFIMHHPRPTTLPSPIRPNTLPSPSRSGLSLPISPIMPAHQAQEMPQQIISPEPALVSFSDPQQNQFVRPPMPHGVQDLSLPPPNISLPMPSAQMGGEEEDMSIGDVVGRKPKRPTSLGIIPKGEDYQPQAKRSPSREMALAEAELNRDDAGTIDSQEFSEDSQGTTMLENQAMPSVPPPLSESNQSFNITQLGKVAPHWVPDAEANQCMQCDAKFTFTRRRHHCRACGKVFCSTCCNLKTKLDYLENKDARVCCKCYQDIIRAQVYERRHTPTPSPNPNNPSEYCSTIPPMQQAQANLNAPPPTVMVPVGVLRKEGSQRRSAEPKQVMFSDGIRPGGDLTELDGSSEVRLPQRKSGRSAKKVEKQAATAEEPSPAKARTVKVPDSQSRNPCLIPNTGLPPLVANISNSADYHLEHNPNEEELIKQLNDYVQDPSPVIFAINKNLFVLVKIVNCMVTVGQDEIVIVLECLPDEKTVPRDVFFHLQSVYEEASKGNTVSDMGHTIFAGQTFLDSKDHGGFLYAKPSFQCLRKLMLPEPPYVFGILLQKWETPWAKVFPLRLLLRLGAEYRYYPSPLISIRFRKPVYGEIGHTIMNLLADFRNYQYMLPLVRGIVIHMEDKKAYINLPKNRYDDVMKVLGNSNEHVMAFGANFSMEADSHLVCIQNEEGNYQTQAINIQNKPRKVTGASFVVFNGALKTSSGMRAKSSIVEDGLMVQITADSMLALKQAMRDMRDYIIWCGSLDVEQPDEMVHVQWVDDDKAVNTGVKSPIDSFPMDGIESVHIHNATDYVGEHRTIRWTEVFFIQNEDSGNSRVEPVDLSRLAETLAQALCIALTPRLDQLKDASLTKIGLRATIDRENVGYEVGANGERLPDLYMSDLDSELIPVIHGAASQNQEGPVILELIFLIIE